MSILVIVHGLGLGLKGQGYSKAMVTMATNSLLAVAVQQWMMKGWGKEKEKEHRQKAGDGVAVGGYLSTVRLVLAKRRRHWRRRTSAQNEKRTVSSWGNVLNWNYPPNDSIVTGDVHDIKLTGGPVCILLCFRLALRLRWWYALWYAFLLRTVRNSKVVLATFNLPKQLWE